MKIASIILLIASGVAALAAVWAPGAWWQWAITALVLLLAGAGTGGAAAKREALRELAHAEQEAAERSDEARTRIESQRRRLDAAVEEERARLGTQPHRIYGRKADDQ